MKPSLGHKMPKSGLYIPRSVEQNTALDLHRTRTIWTPDGEIDVPTKSRRALRQAPRMMRAKVTNIWAKDENGCLILRDHQGIENTITLGAAYNMLHALFGYSGAPEYSSAYSYASDAVNSTESSVAGYNDGSYTFPSNTTIGNYYNGSATYYIGWENSRAVVSMFGQLWFLANSSGGLTGSHIPATVTAGTGFSSYPAANLSSGLLPGLGWFGYTPVSAIGTTYTTMSDSLSNTNSGTPTISHSFTLTASSSAQPFTFDGIAWVPIVGLNGSTTNNGAGTYWSAGSAELTTPTWASASSTPTTIANLQVSALWNPGYAITLNPGGSWGFTYSFQG